MKKFVILAVLFVGLFSCEKKTEVFVYGSGECSHCIAFQKELREEGIPFEFYDIDLDKDKEMEMIELMKWYKVKGNITLPLVLVGNQFLVSPQLSEVQKVLDKK